MQKVTTSVQLVLAQHCNGTQNGRLFGGQLMAWIDIVGAVAARRYAHTEVTTACIDHLDFIAPAVPTGLLFGRLGNFIHGELWGRVSHGDYNHLMYFPQAVHADHELISANPNLHEIATQVGDYFLLPRHPSQLYQAFTEGVLLFVLLFQSLPQQNQLNPHQ